MLEKIAKSELFRGISADFVEMLIDQTVKIGLEKGEYLFREGDEAWGMFFVLKGKLEILAEGQPKEEGESHVLATLGPEGFFGELGMFGGKKRIASVRAVEDSQILYLTAEQFQVLIRSKNIDAYILAYNISIALADKLQKANDMILDLSRNLTDKEKLLQSEKQRTALL